ncbi:FKBP-type peptidyl-prolyl cis-trans isomerase [Streptomyces zaomyceticus]|uniref:Peptidyl-prolyl cis-trans isomerase n=1 Tax=Streptomyces zaomyceticus TaxID=68286 RepID=A0ABZ1L0A8_9ACTN|nr:FKBP-type peptidyl-prolyl cis-trans isomerase [Streptomyces zaomyceticus]WSQ23478.1 FKBP-type peptidyl-prolyl cis-trans isomerase [Streptomyces zaomyceticus]
MSLTKPEIDFPIGDAPTDLLIEDIAVGDGPEAKPGAMVEVHYVGVTFSTGEEFDASWNRGQTFRFPLGGGRVIKGWDQGVEGMKVGGRRRLTIPSHLAYGNQSPSPLIPAGSTLIFVVDLLGV